MTPLDLPEGSGPLLSRLLGPGPQQPGPPYTHVHEFPPVEYADEEEADD